jgi:hypothetical protein
LDAGVAAGSLVADGASARFTESDPANPFIDARVMGTHKDIPFSATLLGPLSHLLRTYEGLPPFTDAAVEGLFAGKLPEEPEGFRLETYPPVAIDAGLYPVPRQQVETVEVESPKQ